MVIGPRYNDSCGSLLFANMKKLVLTAMAMLGLTLAAFGQSYISIDNTIDPVGGIAIDTIGNYYTGTYGLEIWAKTGAIGDNINSFNGQPGGAVIAYANLATDGYLLGEPLPIRAWTIQAQS
jgi:hypothetical protein